MNPKPKFLSGRALPAFFSYLPHLTRKQISELTSAKTGDGKGTPVWVPVSLGNNRGLTEAIGGVAERHPGWWFKGVFSGLTGEERMAWLELLILAVTSAPLGTAYFCSIGQLAAWLGVTEQSMASVLEKAMKRRLIEITEAVFIPVPGESVQLRLVTKAELPAGALKLVEEGSEKILRYYAMSFPGFYTYTDDHLERVLSSKWEQKTGYCRMNPAELDHHLEEPFRLLQEKLAAGKDIGFKIQTKIESPMGNPSSIKLPRPPHYYIDSEAEVEDRLSRKYWALMPISQDDAPKAAVRLLIARVRLMSMFAEHLKVDLPASMLQSR